MNWCKNHLRTPGDRSFFYLLLVFAVALDLAGAGFKGIRSFTSASGAGDNVCELDSFSEPAMAAAILKQESERSLRVYLSNRAVETGTEVSVGPVRENDVPGNGRPLNRAATPPASSGTELQTSAIQHLESLHRAIQEMNADLVHKLLIVYSQNGRWNEFLNFYLESLQADPANPNVVIWRHTALVCSTNLGRTKQILHALDQATRCHRDVRTDPGRTGVMEAEEPSDREAGNR